jgi:hypothetical protein
MGAGFMLDWNQKSEHESEATYEDREGGRSMKGLKELVFQGILGDQDGQDTLEWVAIAALIVLVAIAVMAIVRAKAISGAEAITW